MGQFCLIAVRRVCGSSLPHMEVEMTKNPVTKTVPAGQVVKDIRRAARKVPSSEEKIRIVLSGLRGEDRVAELCRKEGIAQSLYELPLENRTLAGATI
jgi:hypothetical protein